METKECLPGGKGGERREKINRKKDKWARYTCVCGSKCIVAKMWIYITYVCMYACKCVRMYVCMYPCMQVYVCMYVWMNEWLNYTYMSLYSCEKQMCINIIQFIPSRGMPFQMSAHAVREGRNTVIGETHDNTMIGDDGLANFMIDVHNFFLKR